MSIKGGGVRRLMEKFILNFHFDYLTTSLPSKKFLVSEFPKGLGLF